MSRVATPRLPKAVIAELDRVGLPWTLESGRKHWKLVVGGRVVTVIGRRPDWGAPSHVANTIRAIRQGSRRLQDGAG